MDALKDRTESTNSSVRSVTVDGVTVQYTYRDEQRATIVAVTGWTTETELTAALRRAEATLSDDGIEHVTLLLQSKSDVFTIDAVRRAGFSIHKATGARLLGAKSLIKSEENNTNASLTIRRRLLRALAIN